MAEHTVAPLALALVVGGVGYLWAGASMRHRREMVADRPVVLAFTGLTLVAGLAGVVNGVTGLVRPELLQFTGATVKFVGLTWVLPLAWGVFAMTYTGWRQLVTPRRVAVVVGVVLLGTVVVTSWRPRPSETASLGPVVVTTPLAISVQLLLSLVTSLVGLVGVGLLARSVSRNPLVGWRLGLTLCVGGTAPWVGSYLVSVGNAVTGWSAVGSLVPLAAGTLVGAASLTLAVERYHAFRSVPAPGNVGRRRAVAKLDAPVVVLDEGDRVVDCNEAALVTFDAALPAVVRGPLDGLLGVDLETVRSTETLALDTGVGRRQFEGSVARITDEHDRPLGWVVLLTDVTDRVTRSERLTVLNRVLRHNLRNEMNVVGGYADAVGDFVDGEPATGFLDEIEEKADSLSTLGEEARDVEELMSLPRTAETDTDLSTVVGWIVDDLAETHPAATVTTEIEHDRTLGLNPNVLEHALWQLADNAAEYADDPHVTIRTRRVPDDRYPVEVSVADDGPGLPEHEWTVVAEGDETDLEHGSGIGLWIVNWAVSRLGGHLDYEASDEGTTVRIRLPTVGRDPDDGAEDPTEGDPDADATPDETTGTSASGSPPRVVPDGS